MKTKITRREWAVALGASATAAAAQAPPSTENLTTEAATQLRQTVDELRKFNLDMAAEPAFIFKP